jgi:folate-binding protein YgfZ
VSTDGNPFVEQRELAAGRAIVLLEGHGVIEVAGPDRLGWLDSLTSQRLTDLAPGDSAETLLLDPSGRIEYAIRVVDDGESAWLIVDPGDVAGLASFLDRMRFLLRVEVVDRSEGLAVVGAFGDAPPASAPHGVPLVWRDPWRAVVEGGHQYASAPEHPAASWTYSESLVERDRVGGIAAVWVAPTALEALRIAAWRPRAATERDATAIPHEFDWMRSAVHLAKGCYRGQETVAKVHNLGHPPRRLVLLHLDGSDDRLPVAGDRVLRDDVEVGRVTASARHHELGPIALAIVKRGTDPSTPLTVRTAEGTAVAAAQETIVPPDAGSVADVPRIPRLGSRRP